MTAIRRYKIGIDFTEEEYAKWMSQLTWWISSRMPNVVDPGEHAKSAILASLNGTKINGEEWRGVSQDFHKRIKQMVGFDLVLGIGVREPTPRKTTPTSGPKQHESELPPMDIKKAMSMRAEYINDLIHKYPHLDTPVYKPKVEELAETIVKSRMISTDFMTSKGAVLERLSKVRESLHKQIGELMEFLEISPKQRVTKQLDSKNADVGSLVARLESYGETWQEFEKLDALRELLQKYKMLKSLRPDGTPQLNDWELWHMTRNRPIDFVCRCGESYTLLGGFLPEEIEAALIQAQQVYGFGLEPIDTIKSGEGIDTSKIDMTVIDGDFNIVAKSNDNEDPDSTD